MSTPFHFLYDYSALKVLFVGLLVAISFLGTGKFICERLFGRSLPAFIMVPISMLCGVHSYSLVLQLLGFAQLTTPLVLKSLLCFQLILGNDLLLIKLNSDKLSLVNIGKYIKGLKCFHESPKTTIFLAGLLALSLAVNLIIALAPTTKSDEVYVYMHAPLRILQDGGLIYERLANINPVMYLPNLHYQIIAAPFYAFGITDALNVVSWCLSALFIYFIISVVFQKTGSAKYAILIALGMYVGMHSPVWYVTGGSGALSVLSMTMLIYIVISSREMIEEVGAIRFIGLVSFLSMSTAVSKLTYLPVALLCLTVCAIIALQALRYNKVIRVFTASSTCWIIFFLPAFIWSWLVSGHIFGPISDPANTAVNSGVLLFSRTFEGFLYETSIAIADFSPLVWGGCFLFFLIPWRKKDLYTFTLAVMLFSVQIILFIWKLPLHFRYFGGLPLGLTLFFWANGVSYVRQRFAWLFKNKNLVYLVVAICILPWFALQLYYSTLFFPVVLGPQTATNFVADYTPFFDDFLEIDSLLSQDAVILVQTNHMPAYAPRRVIYKVEELEYLEEKIDVYIFSSSQPEDTGWPVSKLEKVYENSSAVIHAYRTPGHNPTLGFIAVYRLNIDSADK